MNIFLTITAKYSAVDQKVADEIPILSGKYMLFPNDEFSVKHWHSDTGKSHLYCFSNETNPIILRANHKSIAVCGYVNNPSSLTALAYQLSDIARNQIISDTAGLYSLCYLDELLDTIYVWNTITRIVPVYWCENEKYYFTCNKALPIHLLANGHGSVVYDHDNAASFLNIGYYIDGTPFRGVQVLTPNSSLAIQPNGITVSEIDNSIQQMFSLQPDEAYYDELAQSLVKAFNIVNDFNQELRCGVTGGKDSRLIVAILKYIGAKVNTFTNGFDQHPDVIIGQQVANILRLPHTINRPNVQASGGVESITIDVHQRAYTTIRLTEGMLSAYENMSNNGPFQNIMTLGGNGGELLRGGFAHSLNNPNYENMMRYFHNGMLKCNELLVKKYGVRFQMEVNEWINDYPKLTPAEILDKTYLFYRAGRWSAAARMGYNMSGHSIMPFFDSIFVKQLTKCKSLFKVHDYVEYNLLKRFAPELLGVPFFNESWKFNNPHTKPPVKIHSDQKKSGFNWRETCLSDMKRVFFDQIFQTASIFDLVDRKTVESIFAANPELKYNQFLWNLYTYCTLISNQWLSPFTKGSSVTIKVPLNIEDR
jgi:hypothetical protein